MKLKILKRDIIKSILAWGGTREEVQNKALERIGGRKVFHGTDGVVTLINVSGDYGWSKLCTYQPRADNFEISMGAKLALLRALGLKK